MSCFLFICLHTTPTPIVWNPDFRHRSSLANSQTRWCVDRWIHNSLVLHLSSISSKPQGFKIQNTSTFAVKVETYVDCASWLVDHWTLFAINVPTEHIIVKHHITSEINICFSTRGAHGVHCVFSHAALHFYSLKYRQYPGWGWCSEAIKRHTSNMAVEIARSSSTPFLTQHEALELHWVFLNCLCQVTAALWKLTEGRQEQACVWARRWETFVCVPVKESAMEQVKCHHQLLMT